MLKRFILFIFCFAFTVMSYATVQEESDQLRIGDEVYTVDDRQSNKLPFTFGQVGRVVDLDTASGLVTVQSNANGDVETYNSNEIYVSEGCLASGIQNLGREICVSHNVHIDINLHTLTGGDIPFTGPPKGIVLGVNENTNSMMIRFVDSMASLLTSFKRPFIYSVDDIARSPSDEG